jgi:hypothetical protein
MQASPIRIPVSSSRRKSASSRRSRDSNGKALERLMTPAQINDQVRDEISTLRRQGKIPSGFELGRMEVQTLAAGGYGG